MDAHATLWFQRCPGFSHTVWVAVAYVTDVGRLVVVGLALTSRMDLRRWGVCWLQAGLLPGTPCKAT